MRVFSLKIIFLLLLLGSRAAYAHEDNAQYRVLENVLQEQTLYAYNPKEDQNIWLMVFPEIAAYAYNSAKITFYIRPYGHKEVYQVNLAQRLSGLPNAKAKRQDVSGISVIDYKDLHQWQISIGTELCGLVLTSREAAEDFRLNFADQVRINQGLREAFSQTEPLNKVGCQDFNVPYTLGRFMGYGLMVEGGRANSSVTGICSEQTLPEAYLTLEDIKHAIPLNAKGRADLLFATLNEEEQKLLTPRLKNIQPEEALMVIKAFSKIENPTNLP